MEKEKKDRTRKAYGKKGERTQKMMAFRVDQELIPWLDSQPNKGRYINDLITADKNRMTGAIHDDGEPPS